MPATSRAAATSPSGTLASEAESIDRDRPVIFHCHVGSRSLMAAQAFRQAGFEAYSMAGGLEVWEQEGRPVQSRRRLNDEGPAHGGPFWRSSGPGGLEL